jgi:hypothetical protein
MIGDPSKSNERNLLDEPTLAQSGSDKSQLSRFQILLQMLKCGRVSK